MEADLWPPSLETLQAEAPDGEARYPESQPSSQPDSPLSAPRTPASDLSSPCVAADEGFQRLCWESSPPSSSFMNEDDPLRSQPEPRPLGIAAAAAANLAASVTADADLEVQIRTAMAESEGQTSVDFDNGLSEFSMQEPESPTTYNFESAPSADEAFVMTYGDYQDWPLDSEEGLSSHSRACDEVLRPIGGGQPFVMRGAEALASSMTRRDDDVEAFDADDSTPQQAAEDQDQVSASSSSGDGGRQEDWESRPDVELPSKTPTADDLRQGLSVLQALSLELEQERRSRGEGASQGRSDNAREVRELRQELQQEHAECRELREQIASCEGNEQHYAAVITELQTELHLERKRLQAETEMAATAERAAVSAVELKAGWARDVDAIREEVVNDLRDTIFAEVSEETQRLEAALAVANSQEIAAVSVATQLRTELMAARLEAQDMLGEARSAAALEKDRASFEAEKAELVVALASAQRSEAQLQSACHSLQREWASEARAAEAARVAEAARAAEAAQAVEAAEAAEAKLAEVSRPWAAAKIEEDRRDSAALALDAERRENKLRSALTESEHQRQLDQAKQEAEKQQLLARVELLMRELEIERQGSAQHKHRLQGAEVDASSLRNENRRLQQELVHEFSAVSAAAMEASAAANAAASSAAAVEERSRGTPSIGYGPSNVDSPAPSIPPLARRLLQDSDSVAATPVGMLRAKPSDHTPALLRSRGILAGSAASTECSTEFHDGITPPRRKGVTPQRPLRLPHAGDMAAGGAVRRATAKSEASDSVDVLSLPESLQDKEGLEPEVLDEVTQAGRLPYEWERSRYQESPAEMGGSSGAMRLEVQGEESRAEREASRRHIQDEPADIAYSPLSQARRLGGPLGLARALAMRSVARSKSPARRR